MTAEPIQKLEQLIRERGALLEGHFQLSSGLHSDRYVQCAKLFQDPRDVERLGRALGEKAPSSDIVVSPALGGILIGYEVARALSLPFVFTEREGGKMTLRRGFALSPGQKALIVEDVLTTGGSSLEVMEVVRGFGAEVSGLLSVIDRGVDKNKMKVPVHSLIQLPLNACAPANCPLCAAGSPVIKPGSRPDAPLVGASGRRRGKRSGASPAAGGTKLKAER